MRRGLPTVALLALAAAAPAGVSAADSFTPVRLTVQAAPVARLHSPLAVTVHVSADAGMLDTRTAPLRVRVKLASECGGTFRYTTGVVLLDQRLNPQPSTGQPYAAVAHGSGRPRAYGSYVVCTFLEQEGDNRLFANDDSVQTTVSKACTVAAARYDALRRSQRARKHRSKVLAARRAARRACGREVPL